MRPPASESENRTHGAKKIGQSQYSDFFNRIRSFSTETAKADVCTCPLRPESDRLPTNRDPSLRAKRTYLVEALSASEAIQLIGI